MVEERNYHAIVEDSICAAAMGSERGVAKCCQVNEIMISDRLLRLASCFNVCCVDINIDDNRLQAV